jgi:TonB-linked SusC/RagA family outer membrane protein
MNKKIHFINKWMMLFVFFFGYILCNSITASADPDNTDDNVTSKSPYQERIEVSGKVTDAETGNPLPGANIVCQETTMGATTDMDGNFTIKVPSDVTLVFSFVGYQEKVVPVEGRTVINVELQPVVTELEEVVAIGYGTRRAGEVTGSVSSVQADDIADISPVDISETLKGTTSGVTAVESHTPGEGATIRVRGLGTINDAAPLWVVDGVPGGGRVSPNQIESISILKSAAAQAIYGARAANGAILVTTKSGQKGQKTQINVTVRNGITRNSNYYDLLNTQEYGEMLWLQAKNANGGVLPEDFSHPLYGDGAEPDIPEYILPARAENVDHSLYDREMIHEDGDDTFIITKANKEGTEWLQEADRDASYQEYAIDVTGGSDEVTYGFMGSYLKEEGVLKYTGYDRYSLRSNVTFSPTDWLEIGERIGLTYEEDYGFQADNDEASAISWTYRMQPIIPVYDVMGGFAGTRVEATGNGENPIFNLWSGQHDLAKRLNPVGNVFANISVIEGLELKSTFGFNYTDEDNRDIGYVEKATSERGKYDGLTEVANWGLQWSWSNTLTYDKTFGDIHDLTAMIGTEAIDNTWRWRGASRENFYSRDPNYMQLDVGSQTQTNYGNLSRWSLFSIFGRLNYEFADKYLFGVTVRRDGSSRFGSENPYGVFPAFSAGWRLTEENFMAWSEGWLDNFKLRLGWGQVGNDRIGNYNSYTTFESTCGGWDWTASNGGSYYPIAGGNSGVGAVGFYRASLGNEDVKWEATTTSNIGFDATLWDSFNVNFDLWKRVTTDMLYRKALPDVYGKALLPFVNVGEMENNGFDLELGYNGNLLDGDFRYNVGLNVSHYQNEITKLTGEEGEFMSGGSFREMVYTRAETGTAFPEFYGYIVDGIFQTPAEADAHPPAFGEDGTYNQPGHFKYRDVNGDEVINEDDRTYIGDPHPDFTAGFRLSMMYKGFTFSTRLYTSYGNDMVNYVRRWLDFQQFLGARSQRRLYESWGSPYLSDDKNATMPMCETDDRPSQRPSTYFVEDASYLRMTNLRLGYNLANINAVRDLNFRKLEIYGQITNAFTISDYSGLDPEVNAGGINKGVDQGAWPTPRQFMFGINIGL